MTSTYPDFDTMPLAGKWRAGSAGSSRTDSDPWTGDTLTEIPQADERDLDEAYRAAKDAQRDWASRPPLERANVMRAAAEVMAHRKDETTGWLVRESGGTVAKAELEWSLVSSVMWETSSMPHHVAGTMMPSTYPVRRVASTASRSASLP